LADRLIAAALWFNPFALAIVRSQIAVREELCDLAVLSGAEPSERRLYANILVEALRLAGSQSLHPSLIRREGGGHAMRLKAILNPAAKPRATAIITASGLALAAAAASLSAGAALARVADTASNTASATRGVEPATSEAASYLLSAKLYEGEKVIGAPRLTLREDGEATVESSENPGYRFHASIKKIDKDHDEIEVQASLIRSEVTSTVARPRITIKRGASARMEISGKLSLTISPIEMKTSLAAHAVAPNGWGSDVTAGKVTRTAGAVIYEGEPTLKLEGQPPGSITIDNRLASVAEVNALPRGSINRIEIHHKPVDAASAHLPLKSIDVKTKYTVSTATPHGGFDIAADTTVGNRATGEYSWSGSPTVTGELPPDMAVLVDGTRMPSGFDIRSISPSKIDRVIVTFASEAERAAGVTPKIRSMNVITKPE
jgi:hypothetical protein